MKAPSHERTNRRAIGPPLLKWYDAHRRDLPWRPRDRNTRPDPYSTVLAEFMCQQTSARVAADYFIRFKKHYPNFKALASASLDEVLSLWAGLGYYQRARSLHKLAVTLVASEGPLPSKAQDLRKLSGIGPYTAAAVASIAFGEPVLAIDGNVRRVLARLDCVECDRASLDAHLKKGFAKRVPQDRPGDFNQALMDLSARLCRPRSPRCELCPLLFACCAARKGQQDAFPVRAKRPTKALRFASAFLLSSKGDLLLRQRPPGGLLGGLWEVPTNAWLDHDRGAAPPDETSGLTALGAQNWKPRGTLVHHFTHITLSLRLFAASATRRQRLNTLTWIRPTELKQIPLPALTEKVLSQARSQAQTPEQGQDVCPH